MIDDSPASHILVRQQGALGRLTLDRPRAINALDGGMIRDLRRALDAWADDPAVRAVLIDGAGERGLCAGGDVRALYDGIVAGERAQARTFFRDEYALNARIARYPKPVIVFADGITMGGGIGLAGHASIRIVTERSRLAMPETRIGFTPDVGGTLLLGRAPGRLGEYLGLTGTSMTAADAVYAGFADHRVASDRLDALRDALAEELARSEAEPVVARFAEPVGPAPLAAQRAWIDEVFAADTLGQILARLDAREEPAAAETSAVLAELSPTALAVTLDAVREARETDLDGALHGEYRRVLWFAEHHPDLVEGIRAQLVDKDRSPRWQPATIAELATDAGAAARRFVPADPLTLD